VALETIEPALVMEERSPPPVDSWAETTMEPAATTRMDVNFMVTVWVALMLVVECVCGFVVVVG